MGYFNFSGYNTGDVLRYNIDDRDLHLLSYFYAIQGSDNMEYLNENFKIYYWVKFEKIIEDNPTLYIKKRTLDTMISNLCEKGLLEKIVKCQEKTTFKKTYFRITDKCRAMMFSGTLQEATNVSSEIDTTNFKETSNEITLKNNVKEKYGEFNNVLLTNEELEKLKEKFPNDWEARIENLSSYLAQFNKKYKSHYATILNWGRKDVKGQSVQNVHNVQNVETQVEKNNEISEEEKNAWFDNLWK